MRTRPTVSLRIRAVSGAWRVGGPPTSDQRGPAQRGKQWPPSSEGSCRPVSGRSWPWPRALPSSWWPLSTRGSPCQVLPRPSAPAAPPKPRPSASAEEGAASAGAATSSAAAAIEVAASASAVRREFRAVEWSGTVGPFVVPERFAATRVEAIGSRDSPSGVTSSSPGHVAGVRPERSMEATRRDVRLITQLKLFTYRDSRLIGADVNQPG